MKRKTEIFTTVKLIAAIILAAIVTVLLTPIQTTKVLYRFFSIYFKEKKELENAPDYWAKNNCGKILELAEYTEDSEQPKSKLEIANKNNGDKN